MVNAFEVDCNAKTDDGGCTAGATPHHGALWVLMLMVGGLIWRRRRASSC